ncbi:EF-hand and coiled-coil domain-containing protein 1 [Alosa sapidissima]|uniref:EF-hand and coiled-coil domain-containing protein 1 n=1 Tax=Alosa sapidissima TaxID=34773 RepID=UPI001C09DFFB|nr:EF-hand and coiled-coil domain-containing protein 1 [Alosa sapidissima]
MLDTTCTSMAFYTERKGQWLRSALCHHYSPDPCVENEILVLSTGIDQYLQEIFHHLVFHNSEDVISKEDFSMLCMILGIPTANSHQDKKEGEEGRYILADLPCELNFREFHARLCGHFSLNTKGGKSAMRLPVTEETEHIEREIRVRWPRVRRRKCVSFDLSREQRDTMKRKQEQSSLAENRTSADWSRETVTASSPQRVLQEQLTVENASLRELVEDLRSALQASDARCIALEVALRRASDGEDRFETAAAKAMPPSQNSSRSGGGRRWGQRNCVDLQRELDLIRSSRDGQLQEAMRYSQQLEAELSTAHRQAELLEEAAGRLRKERAQMRSRMEEARAALASGLKRVEELQGQASQVAPLQERVQQLQTELNHFRYICSCKAASEAGVDSEGESPAALISGQSTPHVHPGSEDSSIRGGEECLQRAVEGRAASDEEAEEEERGEDESKCCLLESKRLIQRLQHCTKGCQNAAVRQIFLLHNLHHGDGECGSAAKGWGGTLQSHEWKRSRELEKELERCQEEVLVLQGEVQQVETERVRLSVLEERLTDALELLLQLRSKRVSRRMLGKILMSSLDVFSQKDQGPSAVLQVVDTLCQQLLSSDLLITGADGGGGGSGAPASWPRVTSSSQSATNPLLISC